MELDQATSEFLAELEKSGLPPLHSMTPTEARSVMAEVRERYGPGPEMAQVRDISVQTSDGEQMAVRILAPTERPQGTIVYYHGGGWVIGDLDGFDTLGRQLAKGTSCVVVLVEYRLAPEHRHPTAVEDAWAALLWVSEHLDDIAGGPVPLVVAGDSAGGNLAAVLTQRARDAGGPSISTQVLVYPVTDCDMATQSYLDPENQLMLGRETMMWFWDHYVPDTEARHRSDASPLQAEDLSGLPPAIVVTAEHDPLHDEGKRYAERLEEAGVPLQYKRFDGQMHGFFTMVNVLPGSAAAMNYLVQSLNDRLESARSPKFGRKA